VLASLVARLQTAGAGIAADARPAFDPRQYFRTFFWLMYGEMSALFPEPMYRSFAMAARRGDPGEGWTPLTLMPGAVVQSHRDWLAAVEQRERYRKLWAEFFEHVDVLITPVVPTAALPHDHRPFEERTIRLGGHDYAYMQQAFWCALPAASYLPAAVVPAGLDATGLPVGVQIIGPYRGDRTVLAFAEFVEQLTGGFQPPPRYR
jgi:amidase